MLFTLEHGFGNVIARKAKDVRICSCPKRDKLQDEKKLDEDLKKGQKNSGENLARANSSLGFTPPPDKKRKLETVEEMIMLPIAKKDFKSLNEIAESLQVARNLDKKDVIKEQRKKLLFK